MVLTQFSYKADELTSFVFSIDTFIVWLKNGRVIHYRPENIAKFRRWLLEHNVRDAKKAFRFTELFR